MAFQDFELTDDGVALLAQVQAELGSLNFTKMKIGNGTYTGDIKDLTDIVSSFHEFDVSSTGVMDDNSVKVQGTFNNTTFGTSYEFREIGVYAKLGDTGAEILYSYSKDETPDTIPDSSTIYRRTLDIRNYISDVDTVTLTVTEIQDRYDFNTVAEMQTAGYLTEGDRCKTWGYSTLGDKLGNEYEVVAPSTGTDDGWNYINLSGSSVQAKLLSRALTDTGYTVDGFLLGKTELVSDTQYMAGDGYWWKLKSDTTSPYTHDATDTPDSTYLEKITHKETLDKVESLSPFMCRAWVKFNGDTSAIYGSGNVTSITKIATGKYTVDFTSAMPHANYIALGTPSIGSNQQSIQALNYTTTSVDVYCTRESDGYTSYTDDDIISIGIFY